jgi:hypothetical protein
VIVPSVFITPGEIAGDFNIAFLRAHPRSRLSLPADQKSSPIFVLTSTCVQVVVGPANRAPKWRPRILFSAPSSVWTMAADRHYANDGTPIEQKEFSRLVFVRRFAMNNSGAPRACKVYPTKQTPLDHPVLVYTRQSPRRLSHSRPWHSEI